MPTYVYRCPGCLKEEEVQHMMSPQTEEEQEKVDRLTCCNEITCKGHENASLGMKWEKVPTAINFLSFGAGDYNKGGLLSTEEKSAKFAERSKAHNKKEGFDEQSREHTKSIVKSTK